MIAQTVISQKVLDVLNVFVTAMRLHYDNHEIRSFCVKSMAGIGLLCQSCGSP